MRLSIQSLFFLFFAIVARVSVVAADVPKDIEPLEPTGFFNFFARRAPSSSPAHGSKITTFACVTQTIKLQHTDSQRIQVKCQPTVVYVPATPTANVTTTIASTTKSTSRRRTTTTTTTTTIATPTHHAVGGGHGHGTKSHHGITTSTTKKPTPTHHASKGGNHHSSSVKHDEHKTKSPSTTTTTTHNKPTATAHHSAEKSHGAVSAETEHHKPLNGVTKQPATANGDETPEPSNEDFDSSTETDYSPAAASTPTDDSVTAEDGPASPTEVEPVPATTEVEPAPATTEVEPAPSTEDEPAPTEANDPLETNADPSPAAAAASSSSSDVVTHEQSLNPNRVSETQAVQSDQSNKSLGIGLGVGVGCMAAIGLAGMLVVNKRRRDSKSSESSYSSPSGHEQQSYTDEPGVDTRWRPQSFMGVVASVVAKLPRSASLRSMRSMGSGRSSGRYNNNNNQEPAGMAVGAGQGAIENPAFALGRHPSNSSSRSAASQPPQLARVHEDLHEIDLRY